MAGWLLGNASVRATMKGMFVSFIIAALALLVVTVAWGGIMDLGAGEQHRHRPARPPRSRRRTV